MCGFLRKVANLRADSWREEVRAATMGAGGAQHLTLWSRDHRKTSAPPPISSSPRWKVRRRAGLSEPQIAARHRPALKRENCKGPAISHRGEEQSRQRGVASDRAAAVQPSISHRLSLLTVTTTVATITTNTAWSLKGNSITNAKQERK